MKGNPGRRPVDLPDGKAAGEVDADSEPTGELLAPDPSAADVPASLQGDKHAPARAIWEGLAPSIVATNLMRHTDRQAFARYCRYLVDWHKAADILDRDDTDTVYETTSNHGKLLRVNPWFLVRDRLEKSLQSLEDRFGLSPAARQAVVYRQASLAGLPLFNPGGAKPAADDGDKTAAPRNQGAIGILNAPPTNAVN